MSRISIASYIRSIVATLSLYNLKELLAQSVAVLPKDSILKSIIKREILSNESLTNASLRKTQKKIKDIIKSYDPSEREPFQLTILKPIQYVFNSDLFVPTDTLKIINEQKAILSKSEKEFKKSKATIKDVSTIPLGPKVLG
jgi:hypothetical protein